MLKKIIQINIKYEPEGTIRRLQVVEILKIHLPIKNHV